MKKHTIYTIPFRRKRDNKTNYRSRLKLLLSKRLRLVVRVSSKNAIAQIVEYSSNGDKVIVAVNSRQLVKLGWRANTGNLSSAYLLGLLLA